MPELPEVEVVRRGMASWARHAIVKNIEVLDERSLRRQPGGPAQFLDQLTGATLCGAQRRGKYLWIPFLPAHHPTTQVESHSDAENQGDTSQNLPVEPRQALVIHLGMSGQVLISNDSVPDPKHLRIRLELNRAEGVEGGDGPDGNAAEDTADLLHSSQLRFVDQRIFGGMYIDDLQPTKDQPQQKIPASITHIGRDPLDPFFDIDVVIATLKKKRTGIKRALLDQNVVSGIGNIYADEALWLARMHYAQATDKLTPRRVVDLYRAVAEVMEQALAEGGTSFDSLYVNVNGESGYFSRSLNVYGREGEYCGRCLDAGYETKIVRERFMNRSSARCPRCQRTPRNGRW